MRCSVDARRVSPVKLAHIVHILPADLMLVAHNNVINPLHPRFAEALFAATRPFVL
jgi:hypothetical protein